MKWNQPKLGDERTFITFVFFPRKINGVLKWLEYAIVKQKYASGMNTIKRFENRWEDTNWGETGET